MNVFDLDQALIRDYEHFARSFTQIRAPDILSQVESLYASGQFWPDPLVTINPHFERGAPVDALVAEGTLHPDTARVFRVSAEGITFHRHQAQAIAKAVAGQSFVVTTGTGSGKSLCFFVPILDAAIRARAAGEAPRTRAIIVYPMNALANSQRSELEKFIAQSGLEDRLRPTFARYTGQESAEERERIRAEKPDILLTNFMMLELLMTRQSALDRAVIDNAQGLDFIVLDELHTYRGRQGADVAMLIRRVRDRLCRDHEPISIGTSATMSSQGNEDTRAAAVAAVATRLFGTAIGPDAVIDESLERATDPALTLSNIGDALGRALDSDLPSELDHGALRQNPLAVWIELAIGLEDGQRLKRRRPITVLEAAKRLAKQSRRDEELCLSQLKGMLILMSQSASERGGEGDRAFLAFKLHRFICGAGHVYATLRSADRRRITLDGQRFDPEEPEARLYATFFCRNCGQEHHPVVLAEEEGRLRALPRLIDETPLDDPNATERPGYLMPEPENDDSFTFSGEPDDYPEDWVEVAPGGALRVRSNRRRFKAELVTVDPAGVIGTTGRRAWFLPGKFRFCPACLHQPAGQAREINKLAGLSAEGRSSATTLLVSSALRWMNSSGSSLAPEKRKLLGFTDNRQDAALQAGHFNDFIFVALLRAATLAATRAAGTSGLSEDEFGLRVQRALGFVAVNQDRRQEWMLDPESKGVAQIDAERILGRALAHRIWVDQRRGWRFTNPNLEDLGLIEAKYVALEELATDNTAFQAAPPELRGAAPATRHKALLLLLDALRHGLAVTTDALDSAWVEATGNASRQSLRDPWAISQQETPRTAAALMIDAPKRADAGLRGEPLIVRGGPRSGLARRLGHPSIWGKRLSSKTYLEVVSALLAAAAEYQLVRLVSTAFDVDGWRLAANAVRLAANGRSEGKRPNSYFVDLYTTLADVLDGGGGELLGLEGREHTAQVDPARREWREWRFRWGIDDRKKLTAAKDDLRQTGEPNVFLPALFCSPTMELGVDISALNAVYLRNMPPTPANYAQRSGRAGRSGQAALIVTYCAAQSPHDQYYFRDPAAMVSGIVRPPALELANRDLVEAHLHAVWLSESARELSYNIPHVLDLTDEHLPVQTDIADALADPDVTSRAATSMRRVLDSIDTELTAEAAPWAADRTAFSRETAVAASDGFTAAFDRWRQLYESARAQLKDANRRSEMHGLPAKERREAKIQQAQANEQIALLERGTSTGGSDFSTYRYLATEGFLPGYNFPRLPLYAYVPATGGGGSKGAYLQRARFLAISEFGPRSLIYHEGRAYRVHKAKLVPGQRAEDGGRLTTTVVYVCDTCGAAHPTDEPERCHACGAAMGGVHPIRNVLRIDNVETQPAERITANDEDRQRQGFDIQTAFSWPQRDGVLDVSEATASDESGEVLSLAYASGATISRLNKGLRRRKEKSIYGFAIDPATGRWTGSSAEGDDDEAADGPVAQRVVPIVQDNKNALLVRLPGEPLPEIAMSSLQHALTRGLEIVFQLEEGEALAEAVPSRENRRAILAFEAAEGGAGVLGRLVKDPRALSRVAHAALTMMHYRNIEAAIATVDPDLLEADEHANCVKGCYRCLLSYYNQPDHELIDRTDPDLLRLLLRLAQSKVTRTGPTGGQATEGGWHAAVTGWGLPTPDPQPLVLNGLSLPLAWRAHLVAAAVGSIKDEARATAEGHGFVVVLLPDTPSETPPLELIELLGIKP